MKSITINVREPVYEDFRQASRVVRACAAGADGVRACGDRSETFRTPAGNARCARYVSKVVECFRVPGAEAGNLFLNWMSAHCLGRKHILDTLLSATWYSAAITRIAATNWPDFAIFEVFEVIEFDRQ
jgi:hypothetical protein